MKRIVLAVLLACACLGCHTKTQRERANLKYAKEHNCEFTKRYPASQTVVDGRVVDLWPELDLYKCPSGPDVLVFLYPGVERGVELEHEIK